MLFLGVDGGGTKTAFTIINEQCTVIFHYIAGTAHIAQIKKQGLMCLFEDFINELSVKNISIEDISYCFFGMPGYSESHQWDKEIHEVLDHFFVGKYTCGNDAVSGWAAGLKCEAGINLVAGTGTICFGVDDKSQTARSGGWGHLIGDEASGFWLGKNVLEIFTKQADGRMSRSAIYDLFREYVPLTEDSDIIDIVYNQWNGDREKVASLSKIVFKALQENDIHAKELINECAKEMVSMVLAVANQLEFSSDTIPVSYSGGVFNMGDYILEPFIMYLNQHENRFSINNPQLKPDQGSALYAAKLGGIEITSTLIDNLI